jgi:hypothetical protein
MWEMVALIGLLAVWHCVDRWLDLKEREIEKSEDPK